MNKVELNEIIKKLQHDCYTAIKQVIRKYCDANNPHKIGDIITDHWSTIKIDEMKYYLDESQPQMVYFGFVLKKDLSPRLDKIRESIYQTNIIKKEQ